jgi:hypothetical protein
VIPHLSCLGSGQENAVLAARELANQARTSTPGHYRTGSKWMKYLFPDMTEEGSIDFLSVVVVCRGAVPELSGGGRGMLQRTGTT